MLLKTITFLDLDGNSLTENFWFHLTKAEVTEMELEQKGGLTAHLTHIVESENASAIIGTFKDIITRSHGIRNADGKGFDKSLEISRKFLSSDAYSELFMELVTDADASADFIKGIVPKDLVAKDTKVNLASQQPVPVITDSGLAISAGPLSGVATVMSEPSTSGIAKVMTEPSSKDLMEMSREELVAAMKAKNEQLNT